MLDTGPPPDALVQARTEAWLDRAVIGLNLCPFAKAVRVKGQIRLVVSAATTPEQALAALRDELALLQATAAEAIDTTLLVLPAMLADFLDFNDFLDPAEALLAEMDLEGEFQLASFHPHYQFAGTDPDDIDNFSNRSPYPTLHLIREASIDRAVQAFPEADAIYERNIALLQQMGLDGWRQLFADDPAAGALPPSTALD